MRDTGSVMVFIVVLIIVLVIVVVRTRLNPTNVNFQVNDFSRAIRRKVDLYQLWDTSFVLLLLSWLL